MVKLPFMPRIAHEVEDRIHAALKAERDAETGRGLRLSAIGRCARSLYFAHTGVEEERPPGGKALRIFEMGDAVESTM